MTSTLSSYSHDLWPKSFEETQNLKLLQMEKYSGIATALVVCGTCIHWFKFSGLTILLVCILSGITTLDIFGNSSFAKSLAGDETHATEFGGPTNTMILTWGVLPSTIWLLQLLCTPMQCLEWSFANFSQVWTTLKDGFTTGTNSASQWGLNDAFITMDAFCVVCGWLLFLALLERIIPCPNGKAEGRPLPDSSGRCLKYRLNGHRSLYVFIMNFNFVVHFVSNDFFYTKKKYIYLHNAYGLPY